MNLTTAQTDRAIGVLLGTACGDALGAGYEFQSRVPYTQSITMRGNGTFHPGEWTDDTAMAYVMAEVAASGLDLGTNAAQDLIVEKWIAWSRDAKDVGIQTRAVFSAMEKQTAAAARQSALDYHFSNNLRSAGNGSLMRTAPVALAFLHDADALTDAARSLSELTHFDPVAGDACVLWCQAIRETVLTGELSSPADWIHLITDERQQYWRDLIAEAELKQPWEFPNNPWVVNAFQAAWSAIVHTPVPADRPEVGVFPAQQFSAGVERAVRAGSDTDTVAAIAGGLLGARWGQSAIPSSWQAIVHGYPSASTADLVALAISITRPTSPDSWPHVERMYEPDPDAELFASDRVAGLAMGEQVALGVRERPFDAVISLCRLGRAESPITRPYQLTVRVMDSRDPAENLNLDFQYFDVARHLHSWLGEGRRVFLHCVHTHNRTPSFFAAYLMYAHGLTRDEALAEVEASLPLARPNGHLRARLDAITPGRIDLNSPHSHFTLLTDDASNPSCLYATASGVTLMRRGGVWIESEAAPGALVLAGEQTVGLYDEREMAREL